MFTAVFALKWLLFQAVFFFWIFRLGWIFKRWFPNTSRWEMPVIGFVIALAFFQALATPILAFHLSFDLMYYPMLAFIIVSSGLSFLPFFQIKDKIKPEKNDTSSSIQKWGIILAIVLVTAQALAASYLQHLDGDDAYYIGTIISNIHSPHVLTVDPASGLENVPPQGQYSFQGWEMLLGVFTRVLQVQPAEFVHSVLPFSLIILSYLAFLAFARRYLPLKVQAVFIILISIFHLFSGFSANYSPGGYLLARVWQGKSLLCLFFFPYLYAILKDYLAEHASMKSLIVLFAVSFAAYTVNPITIYLVPLLVFSFLLIETIRTRNLKAILWAAVILVPYAVYGYFIHNRMSGSFTFNNPAIYPDFTSIEEFSIVVIGSGYYWALYLLAIVFISLSKRFDLKNLFIYAPLVLLVFIWNPWVAPYIAEYLTSYPTYWRVFWLLPLGIGICTTACLLLDKLKSDRKLVMGTAAAGLVIMLCGSWILQPQYGFSLPENTQKLPAVDIEIVHQLLQQPQAKGAVVLAPIPLDENIRQITPDLKLFWSRQHYVEDFYLSRRANKIYRRMLAIILMYNPDYWSTSGRFAEEIGNFKIDYVITLNDLPYLGRDLEAQQWDLITTNTVYSVYQNPER